MPIQDAIIQKRKGISSKLLRAWADDGFVRLARQHESFEEEARCLLERALEDPAASVRARAHRLV